MSREYQYSDLPSHDCIRVLTVSPGHDPKAISCGVKVLDLACPLPYAALSYSWGMNADRDATLDHRIVLEGGSMAVTRNLHAGLRRLRQNEFRGRIWIDAVCINQRNIPERSSQVARMAQIYAKAQEVIVWLGDGSSKAEDRMAWDVITYFQSIRWHDRLQSGMSRLENQQPFEERPIVVDFESSCKHDAEQQLDCDGIPQLKQWRTSPELELAQDETIIPHINTVAQAVQPLFRRRYFSRRWIVQELWRAAPNTVTIFWGPYTFRLDVFMDSIGKLSTYLNAYIGHFSNFRNVPTLDEANVAMQRVVNVFHCQKHERQRSRRQDDPSTFLDALTLFSHLQCSDDRDRLWALTGIDEDFYQPADYSLSTAQTYAIFTRKILEKGRFEFVLYNLCHQHGLLRQMDNKTATWEVVRKMRFADMPEMPTWALDFRQETKRPFEVCAPIPATLVGDMIQITAFYAGRVTQSDQGDVVLQSTHTKMMARLGQPRPPLVLVMDDLVQDLPTDYAEDYYDDYEPRPGPILPDDIVCVLPRTSSAEGLQPIDIWSYILFLRPIVSSPETYKLLLVDTFNAEEDDGLESRPGYTVTIA